MLARLAAGSVRHRRLVVLAWAVALVGLTIVAGSVGSKWSDGFRLDGSDAQAAIDLLDSRFPSQAGGTADIVFKADAGVTEPGVQQRLETLFADVAGLDEVAGIETPYDDGGEQLIAADGKIGYAQVNFTVDDQNLSTTTIDEITTLVADANADGLQVEGGGDAFLPDTETSTELLGLVAAIFILLIAFGSVLAVGVPLGTALVGVGIGITLVQFISHLIDVPDFATQVAVMIGLGVGIDYALFIVTRYREGLHEGMDVEAAIVTAVDTAGRAVLFAGITVVISLLGMLLVGVSFIGGLGVGAASAVSVTVLAAVTLVPALLGFAGHHINKLSVPGLGKHREPTTTAGYRWGHFLQRHPWPFTILGLAILITLAIPVLSMRLGSSDASNINTSHTIRRAYDLKAQGFGPGASGPLLLATELNEPDDLNDLQHVVDILATTPGIAQVIPPIPNEAGDAAIVQLIPTTSSQAEATSTLIRHLRNDVLPEATAGTNLDVHVGGVTAAFDDVATLLNDRLLVFIGIVLGLSFILLMLVFRSLMVPLKAVVMNMLSIGAAYGILVAVFQWGWGKNLIGLGGTGPIESFVPMMLFAVLFGLSMDYEVFLLSRMKEEYETNGHDNSEAVANGLASTARVITAAAGIMMFVFGGFLLGEDRVIKEFGLGLSSAVLIDATVVRMILVPAAMALLGNANWWLPKWLQWLPRLHIEGSQRPHSRSTNADDAERA